MNLASLKANWPTILAAIVVAALLVAKNRGLLTADDVTYVLALGGLTSVPAVHRMQGPS